MNKIAFIDRDGTIIWEPPETKQIDSLSKLKILPNVINGLKKLQDNGYKLLMVSNQNGVGTSSFSKKDFEIPQKQLLEDLKKEVISFYKIFICPHKPEDECDCHKPKTKLVDNFIKNEKVDLKTSIVIGDRQTDEEFANNLGIKFVKMETNNNFPRFSFIERNTKETQISIALNLDGRGNYNIDTEIGFFNHMLELFSKQSLIDLDISANGDLQVDEHHLIEDVGICLGIAIRNALGNKKGIERYGFIVPMDESLAQVALDLSGRSYLVFNYKPDREYIGNFPTELLEDFFRAITDNLKANLHIEIKYGRNEHHKIEAIFKAFARTLKQAVSYDTRQKLIPSTKGTI